MPLSACAPNPTTVPVAPGKTTVPPTLVTSPTATPTLAPAPVASAAPSPAPEPTAEPSRPAAPEPTDLQPGANPNRAAAEYAVPAAEVLRLLTENPKGAARQVFLTFDDGPNHDMSPRVLDVLRRDARPPRSSSWAKR